MPTDRVIDGVDMLAVLTGDAITPARTLFYFNNTQLDAVRDERFKYRARRGVRVTDAGDHLAFRIPKGPWLFDLRLDPQKAYDVSRRHPEAIEHLRKVFEKKTREMEENPRGWH